MEWVKGERNWWSLTFGHGHFQWSWISKCFCSVAKCEYCKKCVGYKCNCYQLWTCQLHAQFQQPRSLCYFLPVLFLSTQSCPCCFMVKKICVPQFECIGSGWVLFSSILWCSQTRKSSTRGITQIWLQVREEHRNLILLIKVWLWVLLEWVPATHLGSCWTLMLLRRAFMSSQSRYQKHDTYIHTYIDCRNNEDQQWKTNCWSMQVLCFFSSSCKQFLAMFSARCA